jgi:hypothetical protein
MIIAPRVTVEHETYGIGYSAGSDMAEYQAHVFISAQLFEKWALEFFFPYLDNGR